MEKHLIRHVIFILLALASLVAIIDQWYLHSQKNEEVNAEIVTMANWLRQICPQANHCTVEKNHLPNVKFLPATDLALPESLQQELEHGNTIHVVNGDNQNIYYLTIGDQLAQMGPFDVTSTKVNDWYTILFYPLLALAIFLSLYPVIKDMKVLKEAATRFARDRDPQAFHFRHSGFFSPVLNAIVWMSQKLARSLALQQELAATLSHEMRTPISRLKFAVSALQHAADRSICEDMRADLDELEQLADEYLSFAKLQHDLPLLDFEEFHIGDIVTPLIQQLGQYSAKKIHCDEKCLLHIVYADRRTLSRALKNLLDNGIKYARSRVAVDIFVNDEYLIFIIEDDGPGLQGQGLEDIFLPYVREDQVAKISGYGLGLAIVRKIIEWHQGEILAGPSANFGGARFELRLPASATSGTTSA